jgi:polar amino acid transport system substrate-binding protein
MKSMIAVVSALLLLGAAFLPAASAGTLDEIRKKGVLVAGVRDATPPFGSMDNRAGELVGYDVDIARAVANRLGVRLETRAVTALDRIPQLLDGNIDLIAATMTINPDRARLVDFSTPYFRTHGKLMAKRGAIRSLADLAGKKVGTARGATAERNLKAAIPGVKVVLYGDYGKAAQALFQGKVAAVATDEVILATLLANAPGRNRYEIPDLKISDELYGIGVRKGNKPLLDEVNATLQDMGKTGEGKKIFAKWFPPGKVAPSVAPPAGAARKADQKAAASPKAYPAAGVVFRRTAQSARYLVMAVKGTFVKDGAVSVFDPQGHFVVGGRVKSIYEDEVYVDLDKGDLVEVGFVVAMNVATGEAQALISQRQDLIASVKAESEKEAADREAEGKRVFDADEKQRRGEQNEFEKMKFQQEGQSDWFYYRHY